MEQLDKLLLEHLHSLYKQIEDLKAQAEAADTLLKSRGINSYHTRSEPIEIKKKSKTVATTKQKMGRPTKTNEEKKAVIDAITQLLDDGKSLRDACGENGISEATYYNYKSQLKKAPIQDKPSPKKVDIVRLDSKHGWGQKEKGVDYVNVDKMQIA